MFCFVQFVKLAYKSHFHIHVQAFSKINTSYPVLIAIISISGFLLIFGKLRDAPPAFLPSCFLGPSARTWFPEIIVDDTPLLTRPIYRCLFLLVDCSFMRVSISLAEIITFQGFFYYLHHAINLLHSYYTESLDVVRLRRPLWDASG